jgi:hypothetical protein
VRAVSIYVDMGCVRCRYVKGENGARAVSICVVSICRYWEKEEGGYVSSICRSVSICVEGGCEMPHVSICRYGEEEEEGGMCRYVSSKGEAKCRMCRYDTNLNRNLYISHSYETSAFTSAFTFI